jgi:hypothetical protein
MSRILVTPPDFSSIRLPARLVGSGRSFWFPVDGLYTHFPRISYIRKDDQYSIIVSAARESESDFSHPDHETIRSVFLNGQPIYGQHPLKDGDYLVYNYEGMQTSQRLIFQQDSRRIAPVSSREDIPLSDRLQRTLWMDGVGIKLNPAMKPVPWEKVHTLVIRSGETSFSVLLASFESLDFLLYTRHELPFSMDKDEFDGFNRWLNVVSPCLTSVYNPPPFMVDAYQTIAREKLVEPMQVGQRTLPYSSEEILAPANISTNAQRSAKTGSRFHPIIMAGFYLAFCMVFLQKAFDAVAVDDFANALIAFGVSVGSIIFMVRQLMGTRRKKAD